MTNSVFSPLFSRSRLASTPSAAPRYSTKVQLRSGESIAVGDPRATRAMVALMDMCAQHGGAASHYGGPAAFAELMSATHALMFHISGQRKQEWHELFHFVNDAGHCENGLYALKANYGFADLRLTDLKKFRSIESFLTGHGEAHLFPQGVLVSNGPLGSGLPQAQGLAVGDALLGKHRLTVCALSDGGAMEGEAKEALTAIPGLARKGKLAPFVCIVSDNRTKLSGRIDQDSFSMDPMFQSLAPLGWKVLKLEDGHNLQACMALLEEAFMQAANDPTTPVLIHARTIKGKGSAKTEASSTGAHGFPLKKAEELPAFLTEIYGGQNVPEEFMAWAEELIRIEAQTKSAQLTAPQQQVTVKEKVQVGISNALIAMRAKGYPVISVSADLQGSTGVADFHKKYPECALDVGVAESNMISTATGLSLTGFVPIVDTFAQFGVTKGALPLVMSNLSLGPVIGVFSHTGFQDAADGASHQALSFFAQVSSIPHTEVYALTSSEEAESLMTLAIEDFVAQRKEGKVPPTRIFFLGRENFPKRYGSEGFTYKLRTAQVVKDTTDGQAQSVTIVAAGSLLGEALKAADQLRSQKIGAVVINPAIINHPDIDTVKAALVKTNGRLITLEEHRLVGGMGALLIHELVGAGVAFTAKSLAIGDTFGQSAYSAADLYQKHGLDANAVVKAAQSLV